MHYLARESGCPVNILETERLSLRQLCLADAPFMLGLLNEPSFVQNIGFAFLPLYWTQGYALEAAAAVTDYARVTLRIERVVAIVSADNRASCRLLRRIGLEFESMIDAPDPSHRCALFTPVRPS
jgi:hypothetical protein